VEKVKAMILSNVEKYPIIIIAPPRSGSSVICAQIGRDLNLPFFSDITYSSDKTEIENCFSFIKDNDKFVMKFHAFDMYKYPEWLLNKIKLGKTYNIKVSRKDFVSHLASVYIAEVRDLYHYDQVDVSLYNDAMEINAKQMSHCIFRLTKAIKELENLNIPFDNFVDYEDYQYDDDACVKTPLPSNYNQIIEFIQDIYKK